MNETTPIHPAHSASKADGSSVRANRKKIFKANHNTKKRISGVVHLAKHNLIPQTASGSINRGGHRG